MEFRFNLRFGAAYDVKPNLGCFLLKTSNGARQASQSRRFARGNADVASEFTFRADFLFRTIEKIDDGTGAFIEEFTLGGEAKFSV